MFKFIADLEYIALHGGNADLDHFRGQEGSVAQSDGIGQELILIRGTGVIGRKAGSDKGG